MTQPARFSVNGTVIGVAALDASALLPDDPEERDTTVRGMVGSECRATFDVVSPATIAALYGVPDEAMPPPPSTYSVSWDVRRCPVVAPRKRRGLTGKAYRIARRGYARRMRAYRRGEIPDVVHRYLMPNVRLTHLDVAHLAWSGATVVETPAPPAEPVRVPDGWKPVGWIDEAAELDITGDVP